MAAGSGRHAFGCPIVPNRSLSESQSPAKTEAKKTQPETGTRRCLKAASRSYTEGDMRPSHKDAADERLSALMTVSLENSKLRPAIAAGKGGGGQARDEQAVVADGVDHGRDATPQGVEAVVRR